MYPITEDDIPFEREILRDPFELKHWLRYIDFLSDRSVEDQSFVLERACSTLSRSYKLWKLYLDLRVDGLKNANPVVYQEEFDKVNDLFERALQLLGTMPRIWISYLSFLTQQPKRVTRTRRCFDRALQTLPVSLHGRIWPLYLEFAQRVNPLTEDHIWSRYIKFNKGAVEGYIDTLVEKHGSNNPQRAAQVLYDVLNDPDFRPTQGKSRFQLYEELVELLVHNTKIRGIDAEQVIQSGISRYVDQKGRLQVNLATYWMNRGENEKAREVLEHGITTADTIRDFTQVFDSFVEFEETLIAKMMEETGEGENIQLDIRMEHFEQLMDRRPFLLNDVVLRQNSNNVAEWQKRADLWGENIEQALETYAKAVTTISPHKAYGKFSRLWINYARFYKTHGDMKAARIILDKAIKVPFKDVDELADVWIAWSEMELENDDIDRAIKVMDQATKGPKLSTIDYFDDSKPPQERLHKSIKLWSFYVDLVESGGDLNDIKPLYERIFELKIGTALTVVNYANLLEENNYFEESFKAYERGLELFSYPIAFELWNIYLNKAVKRNLGLERLRDLFEQALEGCPSNFSKSIYLLYAKLEEEKGLFNNAVRIYERAVQNIDRKDRLELFRHYISRIAENRGLPATRELFQKALDQLADQDANTIAIDFINMEEKLGEIDRARALFKFASQFNDPSNSNDFWDKWEQFEVKYGSEATYKEMLRLKREVRERYGIDVLSQAAKLRTNPALEGIAREINAPAGFVASSEAPLNAQPQQQPSPEVENPDQIDIDI
ncbi:pre-mRNA-splicing factor Syf1p [Trichomonascus vanleenenianus]|uniref:mRNA splicing protein SYF1 n=1 Tax=Trichomonascus vanleenenianus TaxID=2268995 RepID=UPI003ECB80F2